MQLHELKLRSGSDAPDLMRLCNEKNRGVGTTLATGERCRNSFSVEDIKEGNELLVSEECCYRKVNVC